MNVERNENRIISGCSSIGRQVRILMLISFISCAPLFSQSLQVQYDFRHSLDPQNNRSNYPSLVYEYFKSVENGSVFVKTQADFHGERGNIGQFYFQLFREFRFWDPLLSLHLEYNGGLGIAEGTPYGYYLNNAFLLGGAIPFQWGKDWQSASLCYRYHDFAKPSHDAQFSFYWGKNLLRDKFRFSGNFVLFTQNRNRGDAATSHLKGKKIEYWGQPQIWFNPNKTFSIGSQVSLYYHVYSYSESLLVYPAIAVKYQF